MEQTYLSSCCARQEQQNLPLRAELCKLRDKSLPRQESREVYLLMLALAGLEPCWASHFVSAQQPVLEQSKHGSGIN